MAIKIVSAGAGSGKTYRLTSEMVEFLEQGVRPEGIIATTFTKKAAAELQERVRVRLLESGMRREAEALNYALIGTVHGLGVKLLQRFAYEAGVSPSVSIIADQDHQIIFNLSLATVLTEERVERMEQLCIQLGLSDSNYFDWRKEVRQLTEVARANNFSKEILEKSKKLSFASFEELLGNPQPKSKSYFEQKLRELLDQSIAQIDLEKDGTKVTKKTLFALKNYKRELDLQNILDWKAWAKLSKLKIGAKSKEAIAELTDFAKGHYQHPQFLADIRAFIYNLFDISIAALAEYELYKKERGLIDYTDMEVLVSQLLDHPTVKEILKEELDLLMVDEFQDTSPIQLEIFLKLSQYAKSSVWVGDPKQSIYGFRGAAPELMQAIIKNEGGVKPENIQKYSWRSREDVVFLTNSLFSKAFSHLVKEQVVLIPKRRKVASSDSQNEENEPIEIGDALHHWHFKVEQVEGKKTRQPGRPWMENAIANTLKVFLDRKSISLQAKGSTSTRFLKAGDIAILCRSNTQCQEMADALHRAGLNVAISRSGLLKRAESKLILACLKFILNRNDSLSVAELLLLAKNRKIEDIIEDRLTYLEALEGAKNRVRWGAEDPFIEKLNLLRPKCSDYSSTETLDLILEELDLRRIIVSWGKAQQRLDNVDRLRYYAQQYEENCNRLYAASSLGGFLLWLLDLERQEQDMQASGEGADAVNVLTYHKSKGLEWPMVICSSLEQSLRADIWGLEIVPESEEVDINNILGKRWLRYWVNPYDRSLPGTFLAERVSLSEAQKNKQAQALEEENRLLYVGLTRARDYIVFPSAANPTRWLNRSWHGGKEDFPTLDPSTYESPWEWEGKFLNIQTETFIYPKVFREELIQEKDLSYWEQRQGKKEFPAFYIDPVKTPFLDLKKVKLSLPQSYSNPMLIPEQVNTYQLAKGLKAFLTAYYPEYAQQDRLEMARGLVERYELEDVVNPKIFENLASHWFKHIHQQWKPNKYQRKLRLDHWYKAQKFETILDLVLENEQQIIIIQYSGFAGEKRRWKDKALELSSLFYLAKDGLQHLFPNKKISTYLNLVLQGTLIEVDTSDIE